MLLLLQGWNICLVTTMFTETWQLGTAWSAIILPLRYQTSDFQEMCIPRIITGDVFNFSEVGENEIFGITVLLEYIHIHVRVYPLQVGAQ
jgi:hypothetical protein